MTWDTLKHNLPLSISTIQWHWQSNYYNPNFSGSRSSKTFKPKKNIPEGSHQHDLMKHAAATLGSGKTLHYICTDYQRNENVRLFFFGKKSGLWAFIWYCAFINFKRSKIFFQYFLKKSKLLSINVTWPKIGIQYLSSSSFVKNSMQKNLRFILNSLDFWRILSPVRLFHHVRLLIFGDSPTLCDYFTLFVYLILKSTEFLTHQIFGIWKSRK